MHKVGEEVHDFSTIISCINVELQWIDLMAWASDWILHEKH